MTVQGNVPSTASPGGCAVMGLSNERDEGSAHRSRRNRGQAWQRMPKSSTVPAKKLSLFKAPAN